MPRVQLAIAIHHSAQRKKFFRARTRSLPVRAPILRVGRITQHRCGHRSGVAGVVSVPLLPILDQLEIAAGGARDDRQRPRPSLRARCWRCLRAATRARRYRTRASRSGTSSRLPGEPHDAARTAPRAAPPRPRRAAGHRRSTQGARRDRQRGSSRRISTKARTRLSGSLIGVRRVTDPTTTHPGGKTLSRQIVHALVGARPKALRVDAVTDVR